jgi:pimeloyl-ACP methyl ester carboxylesterase
MSDYTPPAFKSTYIPHPLSPSSQIHLITCSPLRNTNTTPILLVHGLGSSASFWLPALATDVGRQLTSERQVYAIDAYGHGISDFVAQEDSLDRAAETVVGVIEGLIKESGKEKVVLVGHSMSGVSSSLFSRNPC